MKDMSVWIGFDPREADAFAVTKHSIRRRCNLPIPIYGLVLDDLRMRGMYTRETIRNTAPGGRPMLFDVVSQHPMATEFAISRFFVPLLARERFGRHDRWAVFMDSDMLCRRSIDRLFDQANPDYAVQVVKHDFNPAETVKMGGQVQSQYARKNWSSVILWNVDHPAHDWLTLDVLNKTPGRDLHAFCWLPDHLIGDLTSEWNYLVGHNTLKDVPEPSIVHFTDGVPSMQGYENVEFAGEWWRALHDWARGDTRLTRSIDERPFTGAVLDTPSMRV